MKGQSRSSLSDGLGNTTALGQRARGGSLEAFGELYERVAPAVFVYACARIGWGWEDAEDVVSEVWVRALEKIDVYDPRQSFRGWIFGFATRVAREVQREVRRDFRGEHGLAHPSAIPDCATSVSRRVRRQEGILEFVTWLRKLNDYEREVMLLHGLEGWPFRKVGQALGRDEAAVQKCWCRLLVKTKEFPTSRGLLGA